MSRMHYHDVSNSIIYEDEKEGVEEQGPKTPELQRQFSVYQDDEDKNRSDPLTEPVIELAKESSTKNVQVPHPLVKANSHWHLINKRKLFSATKSSSATNLHRKSISWGNSLTDGVFQRSFLTRDNSSQVFSEHYL